MCTRHVRLTGNNPGNGINLASYEHKTVIIKVGLTWISLGGGVTEN